MKKIVFATLIFSSLFCYSQKKEQNEFTYENFNNEILKYKPGKKNGVSEKDFNKGVFKLSETKKAVKNNPENFTYADYWNITMAFVNLDESNQNIEIAFKKAIELDTENICTVIKSFGNSELDIRIPKTFYSFLKNCSNQNEKDDFDLESYAIKNGLELKLVNEIYKTQLADIKYRFDKPVDWSKQKLMDEQNQKRIDSLFNNHNTYIGKSLVGEKFESTMWAVIQHSNTEMMEKYLPIIQKAVQEKELNVTPLKMLIDRYYGLKHGYQVFGSQSGSGFKLADEETRTEVKIKFGIE